MSKEIPFETRLKINSKKPKVNNASLRAGSPMYYYCSRCEAEIVMPELHSAPAPKLCGECIKETRPGLT